jgi:hypothetical protein
VNDNGRYLQRFDQILLPGFAVGEETLSSTLATDGLELRKLLKVSKDVAECLQEPAGSLSLVSTILRLPERPYVATDKSGHAMHYVGFMMIIMMAGSETQIIDLPASGWPQAREVLPACLRRLIWVDLSPSTHRTESPSSR